MNNLELAKAIKDKSQWSNALVLELRARATEKNNISIYNRNGNWSKTGMAASAQADKYTADANMIECYLETQARPLATPEQIAEFETKVRRFRQIAFEETPEALELEAYVRDFKATYRLR